MDNDAPSLSTDSAYRKTLPIATGVLDYFPAALADIARLSRAGNEKHNPGQPLHWSRGKSSDHADCIIRHLVDRGTVDPEDGIRHATKAAWRALALLQQELEDAGLAPLSRGSRAAEPKPEPELPPADEHFSRTKAALKQPIWVPSEAEVRALRRNEADYQERRALDGF